MGCFYSPWGQEHWRWNGTLHCSLGLIYDLTWPTLGLVYGTDKFLSLRWQRSGFMSCFRYMLLKSRTVFLLKKNIKMIWKCKRIWYAGTGHCNWCRENGRAQREGRTWDCVSWCLCLFTVSERLMWWWVYGDNKHEHKHSNVYSTMKREIATIRLFLLWLFFFYWDNACDDL